MGQFLMEGALRNVENNNITSGLRDVSFDIMHFK
jgi:hypothetical protein